MGSGPPKKKKKIQNPQLIVGYWFIRYYSWTSPQKNKYWLRACPRVEISTGSVLYRPEYGGHGEVASVPGVAGDHHVLGVEHLLGELGHAHGSVRLAAAGRQGREPGHEEMEPGERDHVDGQLAEIGVQLAGEPQARGYAGHGQRHQVVEVAVRRVGQLQRPEADVVQRLVVNQVRLVRVLDQLMHGERRVVRLHHRVRNLRRWHHRVRVHYPVRILLADLRDEQRAQSGTGAASQRVRQLETLRKRKDCENSNRRRRTSTDRGLLLHYVGRF